MKRSVPLLLALAAGAITVATAFSAQNVPTTAGEKRYLYVARASKDRGGFRDVRASLEVHDIDDGHRLVRTIPLPANVFNVRGLCASGATSRLYVAHYGQFKGKSEATGLSAPGGGRLLCLDLATDKVLWEKAYPPSADRMAVSPDGRKIYFPAGEERTSEARREDRLWTVIDAQTGAKLTEIEHVSSPHNTIVSLDSRLAFLQAFGAPSQRSNDPKTKAPLPDENPADDLSHANGFLTDRERSIAVVDTTSDKIIRLVGPFQERTRPFTINGSATLLFQTVNDWIGFQVADVRTGRVLFTVAPPASAPLDAGRTFAQVAPTANSTFSHGIGLTADEQHVYVVDQRNVGLHVFDVSGLPGRAPVWKTWIKTRRGREEMGVPAGERIFGQPGWIMSSLDGKFFYAESGEIVDTTRHAVVGQLVGANKRPTNSRFALEVAFKNNKVVRAGDQFALGRRPSDSLR